MTLPVDALKEKFNPEQLGEQAKTRATDKLRTTGCQATETLKQNPAILLAVEGGLLAVLLLRRLCSGEGGSETVVVDLNKRRARRG